MDSNIFDIEYMIASIPFIAKGIPVALNIAIVAFIFGLFLGLLVALLKIYPVLGLTRVANLYVSFMRGTPLLVQIFLAYYGIPILFRLFNASELVSQIPAIYVMYVTFSLNVGAYLSETIRASITAIPKGQIEAAYSIGMTTSEAMRIIVIPQAVVSALPNLGNQFIMLLKNTSLAFLASVPEIIGQAKILAGRTSQFFEVYIVAAIMYWIICIVIEKLLNRLERRFSRHL